MNQERLLKVILSPHVSEKATVGTEKLNSYVFRVVASATKPEIKDAIEHLFNAKVKSVRIVNVRSKTKIFRGIEGKKKGWKKAYVTLQADQKLDIIGAQ
ncbi:50S ribosomal protein L23 [Aquicella lusitana]|uniref:Large ribosomal subunit protein uL23 n=1 Tax=Aquicella lusitana TaxID=254246 RepID=A0A370GTH2_9COXI|nr:50S ribosomal protein L23 [Aquicella lusitana]RDI46975.1 LSU ribosomal protein L23P [Aquicella lusitana]VVC73865.1 50S ribosomal protein L23 [Aquicella lusitana]